MGEIMKKRLIISVLFALTLSLSLFVFSACHTVYANERVDATLLFFDDFDTLDTDVWNIHNELRKGGYWADDQAYVKDGNLVLNIEKKDDGNYYMGAIDTKDKYETRFGYFEARCFLPKASGIWSAFWIMPQSMEEGRHSSDVNLVGAEIDIMESPYYNPKFPLPKNKETYQCAVHVGDYGKHYRHAQRFINTTTARRYSKAKISIYDDWHTYGLHWTDKFYRFYFDRQLVYEIKNKKLVSTKQDGYLFLSIEVGGTNGNAGKPPFIYANGLSKNQKDAFPNQFLVDYVAVYDACPF